MKKLMLGVCEVEYDKADKFAKVKFCRSPFNISLHYTWDLNSCIHLR